MIAVVGPPPLRALGRWLGWRLHFPHLGGLARLLDGALEVRDNYGLFRELCAVLFAPPEVATILGPLPDAPFADYDGRVGRFSALFRTCWYEIDDFDRLGDRDDGLYSWMQHECYLPPLGMSWAELAEPQELSDADLILAALLVPEIDGQEARLDELARRGLIAPGEAALAPTWGLPVSVVRAAFAAELREQVESYWWWLYQETGNPFLDAVYDDEAGEPHLVSWHPDQGRGYFAALRREWRDALDTLDGLFARLRSRVDADPGAFFREYGARIGAAVRAYRAGDLPLLPGSVEATLAQLVADLCDEREALDIWAAVPAEGQGRDLVVRQFRALSDFLGGRGLPLDTTGYPFGPVDVARHGLPLATDAYRPPAIERWIGSWSALTLARRVVALLAGARGFGRNGSDPAASAALYQAYRARFAEAHPALAGALGGVAAGEEGIGEAMLELLVLSPYPALPTLLRWCRREPVGNRLLDLDAECGEAGSRGRYPLRIPARREDVDRWVACRRDADAQLDRWRALLVELGGTGEQDEMCLEASLNALGAFVKGAGRGPGQAGHDPPTAGRVVR